MTESPHSKQTGKDVVKMIYLDNAATTMVAPEVQEAMAPYFGEKYGNPGSPHSMGLEAAWAVKRARIQVAQAICSTSSHIVFTAGGSEANNLAIKGFLAAHPDVTIVTDMTEHDSVLQSVAGWPKERARFIPPRENGTIGVKDVERAIDGLQGPALVSIMLVNNETGAVNSMRDIARVCHEAGAKLHVDAVQALGSVWIDIDYLDVDFLSISSHKVHGPKGVGALYVRDKKDLQALISGGSAQEFGLRAGTENVPGIVGFGKACELILEDFDGEANKVLDIKYHFYEKLCEELGFKPRVNGRKPNVSGKILNLTLPVDGETLVMMCSAKGLCISGGSACTAHEQKPSHVLKAMGLSDEDAHNSIRVSFSKYNTRAEAESAAVIINECINKII